MKKIILIIAAIACFQNQATAQTYTINTIAGTTNGYSGDGGPATLAQFAALNAGLVADSVGNIYISDWANYRVRKIDKATGVITTFAGTGVSGFSGDGGLAVNAQIAAVNGMVITPSGDALIIIDGGNNRARKINFATGIITTIFGNGNPGTVVQNVTATSTPVFGLRYATFNPNGDLILSVGSTGDCAIYKVNKLTNIVTRIVGNGTQTQSGDGGLATAAGLNQPKGIAYDANGDLYIADFTNRIRKVNSITGIITTIAGGPTAGFLGDGGPATLARINTPGSIYFDCNNNLIFDDSGNNRIRMVNVSTGIINTFAGTGTMGATGDGGAAINAQITGNLGQSFYGNTYYTTGYWKLREIKLSGTPNLIFGKVFVDCNNNCLKDPNEFYSNAAAQVVATNGTNSYTAFPNAYGNYSFNGLTPGIYTVTPAALTNYTLCSGTSFTANITSTTSINYNFSVKETGTLPVDYSSIITLANGNPGPGAVPGGTITLHINNNIFNASACSTVQPTKLKVILPTYLSYINVAPNTSTPNAIIPAPTGDTIVWNNPQANDLHTFTAFTATNSPMGGNYCVKSIVYPLTDANPLNNTFSFCDIIGGPYDPNDKSSEAIGMSANGDILTNTTDLTYTIRFQNLGTGPAVNVLIKDTIDANLDLNSLQVLASSFPVQTEINRNSKEVNFRFNTIFLPAASVNEPGSHGFVRFKINLNNALPVGTTLKNRAHIYFDYNAAITTNQTMNTIISATSNKENELTRFVDVYPNPTNNDVFINSSTNIINLEVFNNIGQMVSSKENVNATKTKIELTNLPEGIYFIQLHTASGVITKKLIKQ